MKYLPKDEWFTHNLSRAEWVEQARYWHREYLRGGLSGRKAFRETRDICLKNARLSQP